MRGDSDKTVEMPRSLAEMIAGSDEAIAGLCRMSDEAKREMIEMAHRAQGAEEMRRLAEDIAKYR